MPNPVHKLDREMRKWTELRDALLHDTTHEWTEDDLLSALESETDLSECISDLSCSLIEDETQLDGLDATIMKLEARAVRHKKAVDVKRAVILKTMERAGLPSLRTPEGTLTISNGKQSVVVFEQASLPEKYLAPREPKVDKVALGKDLRAGMKVTGAVLSNGPPTLTIRRS